MLAFSAPLLTPQGHTRGRLRQPDLASNPVSVACRLYHLETGDSKLPESRVPHLEEGGDHGTVQEAPEEQ